MGLGEASPREAWCQEAGSGGEGEQEEQEEEQEEQGREEGRIVSLALFCLPY